MRLTATIPVPGPGCPPVPLPAVRRRRSRALSLIEIMVTVALLSVIIIGLVAMFNQVHRAFNFGLGQVDYLESGRSALDMIGREVEQMAPCNSPTNAGNFYVDLAQGYSALLQPLAIPGDVRTNALQFIYFLTRSNLQWYAVGYKIDPGDVPGQIGALYRYSAPATNNSPDQAIAFRTAPLDTNYNRVIDGVVSFRVRAYDPDGVLLRRLPPRYYASMLVQLNFGENYYYCWSNAVPAYVELELAVLEGCALERYRSMTNNPANALNYLTSRAGQVHVFRQRVPIRAVDPAAYQP